ncbi:SDR family oxidoreductase [Nakamurella sp. YIM 132087]|uniref:SDR family oxidoreductase n=1 Tax=Nakamurella alba TaxID=2665158 RepID=A0A7K1FUJ3_9ACTN|nr:SDR family oxidoreductase [Nakamurella alba]MTD17019.1 SDR family oxidoreductase [Nakamurella alba]
MAEQPLAGRRAMVTGAGSGIGAAIAARLVADGAEVTCVDVNADAVRAVADQVGGTPLVVDLSDQAAVADMAIDTDILVSNAGIQHVAPIDEFPLDRFDLIMRLMVHTPFQLVRSALPGMYERGFGRVVHISSAHGLRASLHKSAYVMAKHATEGLSKVTALEGAGRGVTSNCVNPGYVRTPLVQKQVVDQAAAHGMSETEALEKVILARAAIKELIDPEDIAAAVAFVVSPSASMMTGASLSLDGGWTAT